MAGNNTVVRNSGPTQMFFGFLPPHGKTIAAGATYEFEGDIRNRITDNAGAGGYAGEHSRQSLQRTIDAGLLEIVSTPEAISD